MKRRSGLWVVALAAAAICLGPGRLRSQDNNAANDAPGRAARLGLLQGTVSFQPGGVEDWVPATLNRPIATGDRLWTEAGARAELHLGTAAIRLNQRTSFTFLNLTDNLAQVQVSSGTIGVRIRNLNDQETVEIDTPQAAFSLLRAGEYRIDVTEDGNATIATVRGGEAEVTTSDKAFPIRARDQVRVTEENGQPVFDQRTAPVGDGFDNWCQDRDRREDRSESSRHMSRDIPGHADLDDNGTWRQVPDYGWVWVPRAEVGWAPYHYGHWAWVEPWGWTWIDDAPWGYAPFHYGRWVFVGTGWAWVPGPAAVRPVYAPALVAWVGGPGFSIGVSVGGPPVGWFALGPREVFVPAYRYSPAYIERVNVTNTVIVNRTVINNVNVTNVNYVNRGVPGAITAVPRESFTGGVNVSRAAVRVPPDVAARAQVSVSAAVAPRREAVLSGRASGAVAPPAAVMSRAAVVRQAPPPAAVPFAQRQAQLEANPGRPIARPAAAQSPSAARPGFRPAFSRPQPAPGQSAQGQPNGGQPAAARPAQQGGFGGPGAQQPRPANVAQPNPTPAPQPQARPQPQQPQTAAPQRPTPQPQSTPTPQQPAQQPQASRPQPAQPEARRAPAEKQQSTKGRPTKGKEKEERKDK